MPELKVAAGNIERRVLDVPLEVRADSDDSPLVGYAAVFNSPTRIGGRFVEMIAPGAFARAISEGQDVRALFNHDPNIVIGRTKNGTLKLSEDDRGLRVEIDPPDTQDGRDIRTLVKRGDISQMSFGFIARAELWEESDDEIRRTVTDADIFDVSPVTYPAYEDTEISTRAAEEIARLEKSHAAEIIERRSRLDRIERESRLTPYRG